MFFKPEQKNNIILYFNFYLFILWFLKGSAVRYLNGEIRAEAIIDEVTFCRAFEQTHRWRGAFLCLNRNSSWASACGEHLRWFSRIVRITLYITHDAKPFARSGLVLSRNDSEYCLHRIQTKPFQYILVIIEGWCQFLEPMYQWRFPNRCSSGGK